MTTAENPSTPTVPTVTPDIRRGTVIIARSNGLGTVIPVPGGGCATFAADIRGALADAYRAGQADAATTAAEPYPPAPDGGRWVALLPMGGRVADAVTIHETADRRLFIVTDDAGIAHEHPAMPDALTAALTSSGWGITAVATYVDDAELADVVYR